jgi:hypothetical protein
MVNKNSWQTLRIEMRWYTKGGATSIHNMTSKHILNCISLIQSKIDVQGKWWGYSSTFWLLCLKKELSLRKRVSRKIVKSLQYLFPYSPFCKKLSNSID